MHAFHPHKIRVGTQLFCSLTMSPYLRRRIFGMVLDNMYDWEDKLRYSRSNPGFAHFSSHQRLDEICWCDNVHFTKYHDLQNDQHYVLTSYAILMDKEQKTFKAYGWTETNTHIMYVYSYNDDTPVSFVVLPQPEFAEIGTGRNKKHEYVFDLQVSSMDGLYTYNEFHPATVYVTSLRHNNTKMLAPWLCYQKDNLTGNIFIISHLSS